MVLAGLKQRERYFKPVWCVIFIYNLIGAVLFGLGVLEIIQPEWWTPLSRVVTDAAPGSRNFLRILGITFFLFPISLLVATLRFPFSLLKRTQKEAKS